MARTVGTPPAADERTGPESATVLAEPGAGWMRRLAPLVLAQRGWLAVALVTSAVSIVAQVSVPVMVRRAIDAVGPGGLGTGELNRAVIGLLMYGVLRFVFGAVSRLTIFRVSYRIDLLLRSEVYSKLTQLSWSFYDRTQSGQIISRANADIRSIQLYIAFVPLLLTGMVTFCVALVLMLRIHVLLTLVAIATLPGVFALGNRFRNRVFPLTWITQARAADVATIVSENINGTRVVKSFAAEKRQIKTFARAAQRLQWASIETIRTRGRYNPMIEALPRFGIALVLLYGGWLAIDGAVTIGTLFQFNAYVLMLVVPFRLIGFVLLQAQRARASAGRVFEILDEEPDIINLSTAVDLRAAGDGTGPVGRIEFDDVTFRYPTDADSPAILRGFTLAVAPGETVAIVGRTGCGKSTVGRLLARFYDVNDGAVRIDGHDVRDLTTESVRHRVGLVSEEPFLFSQSVHDNIAYGRPDASRADVIDAAKAAHAHDFIEELGRGYDTVVGERGYTLSGGQRQRIAIARSLLYDPQILILDDATSAIDVTVEEHIHRSLRTLLGRRTTIVIAHRLSTISLADRVVLIEAGAVVADGTHEHLLATDPRYVEVLADATGEIG